MSLKQGALIVLLGAAVFLSAASVRPTSARAAASASPGADLVAATLADIAAKNSVVQGYSFDLAIHVALVSFPWVRFSVSGHGQYSNNGKFMVHFDHVPWFGKGYETIKLDPLEPEKWPEQYTIVATQMPDGSRVFVMHDRKKSPLTEARATIDPNENLREIVWKYNYGGTIRVTIQPTMVSGHAFPSSDDAEITMPNYHAVVHADFTNYVVTLTPTPAPM